MWWRTDFANTIEKPEEILAASRALVLLMAVMRLA
jgi:hypothetical protein